MDRTAALQRVRAQKAQWDMVVVGGGATGIGIAIDGASRGYSVLLLEQSDFGKGASSRSTKLAHGGVRYLQQGNVRLVAESLRERGLLLANAPHLVKPLEFIVPAYAWWERPYYGAGLKLYTILAGRHSLGGSRILSREEVLRRLPGIKTEGLRGGVLYFDGQFDDTRLLIQMAVTAVEQGATILNYAEVTGLTKDHNGLLNGVVARDLETGEELRAAAKVVINATGAFADALRREAGADVSETISPSQGSHVVLDRSFLPGDSALMVPHTSDGRVLFAIPWLGHTLVGTTDVPVAAPSLEPVATEREIEFILSTAAQYLAKRPTAADALSVFAGIRPLARSAGVANTAALSRDHAIHIDKSGLVTITGGKWTTWRRMAEGCVNRASDAAGLRKRPCVTRDLKIHGSDRSNADDVLSAYGSDAILIRKLATSDPALARQLDPALPYIAAEVVWAARFEMARTVEDALARRTRALFLNARAAMAMAPEAARLMSAELNLGETWQDNQIGAFRRLARNYLPG